MCFSRQLHYRTTEPRKHFPRSLVAARGLSCLGAVYSDKVQML